MFAEPKQCMTCKHYRKSDGLCAAFPDMPGIPIEILDMEHDHRKPFPNDNGIQWEPKTADTRNPFEEDSNRV